MNLWLIIYRLACVIFAIMLVIVIIALFLPKVRQAQERQRKAAVIEEQNRAREKMTKQLRENQEQFMSDPKYVERVAREELGKAKPGETIFRFIEKKTNEYRIHR